MLGSAGKGWPPGEWLWEDGGSGGGPSPFSGLTMGERRPGPNLENTEAAVSRMGSGVGLGGQRHGHCCLLPSSNGELTR